MNLGKLEKAPRPFLRHRHTGNLCRALGALAKDGEALRLEGVVVRGAPAALGALPPAGCLAQLGEALPHSDLGLFLKFAETRHLA